MDQKDLPIFDSYIDLNGHIYNSQAALYAWLLLNDVKYKTDRKKAWKIIQNESDDITNYAKNTKIPNYVTRWVPIAPRLAKLKNIQDQIENMPASQMPAALKTINGELLPTLSEI